ncbi:portal protein [Ferrovibrio sp.]|uniref:portal protein n=1 Tax=Ferrovibrio sp. TaxID=1917215 RepID=UPI0035B19C3A
MQTLPPMSDANIADPQATDLRERFRKAKAARSAWETRWRDCFDYTLPLSSEQHGVGSSGRQGSHNQPGRRADTLFDGTAADAVDQLAASLLAQLTPPWSRWFAFQPGEEIAPDMQGEVASLLDRASARAQNHIDRSDFAVAAHQCYLDLVTAGTACLAVEEAELGAPSVLRFTAVPIQDVVLEEGPSGRLDVAFRQRRLSPQQLLARYPRAAAVVARLGKQSDGETRIGVLECVLPREGGGRSAAGYDFIALLEDDMDGAEADSLMQGGLLQGGLLERGRFQRSPFIAFRWIKAAGDVYGRSPVMKALPDIKTANKVVELVLKNASIAVTGIWQADDDGVLNPANVKLVPGAIIPKAVGSSGLTPLAAPGRFDISQLVLDDLRGRIRHALLVDRLGQVAAPKMSATEVLERAAEMARLLGAVFGRLQGEFLTPLIDRVVEILQRRGEIPDFALDGREVKLAYQSPLARVQSQADIQGILMWLEQIKALGPAADAVVDKTAVARWLGRTLGVPGEFLLEAGEQPADPQPPQQQQQQQQQIGADPMAALAPMLQQAAPALQQMMEGAA